MTNVAIFLLLLAMVLGVTAYLLDLGARRKGDK